MFALILFTSSFYVVLCADGLVRDTFAQFHVNPYWYLFKFLLFATQTSSKSPLTVSLKQIISFPNLLIFQVLHKVREY